MSDPKGNYKMRFIGRPQGRLMKGAPGNYVHGQEYKVPYHYSRFAYWELVEPTPEVEAPEPSEEDSVYEEEPVYVPDEDEAVIEVEPQPAPMDEDDINIDPNTDASIDPYMKLNPVTGVLSELSLSDSGIDDISFSSTDEVEVPLEDPEETKPDRDELLKILTEAGVEVKPRTRTTTLEKMVDELGSEEES